jgi:hypothetical protein
MERTPQIPSSQGPEWMEHLQSSLGVERVFGTPVERGGTLIIPVASVRGGGGGGSGHEREGGGQGGGFGLSARPAGVFVVREGRVDWRPAVDANRVLLGMQLLAAIAFWVYWAHRPQQVLPRLSRRRLLHRLLHS